MERFPLPPRLRRAAHSLWLAATTFTVFFSLYPGAAVDATFSAEVKRKDWLFHTLCYAGLAFLHPLAFRGRRAPLFAHLRVFAMYSLLGAALELAQALPIVNRSCRMDDALHNALGAALGAAASLAALRAWDAWNARPARKRREPQGEAR